MPPYMPPNENTTPLSIARANTVLPALSTPARHWQDYPASELSGTGKELKNVLVDTGDMLESSALAAAEYSVTALTDGPNGSKRQIEVFNLTKREDLILVSGYSVAMRTGTSAHREVLHAQRSSGAFAGMINTLISGLF